MKIDLIRCDRCGTEAKPDDGEVKELLMNFSHGVVKGVLRADMCEPCYKSAMEAVREAIAQKEWP